MRTLYTAAVSALLCSLLWIGGTAKIIDEYIKIVQINEFQINSLKSEIRSKQNVILMYDRATKELIYSCTTKLKIYIGKEAYICYKIEKA